LIGITTQGDEFAHKIQCHYEYPNGDKVSTDLAGGGNDARRYPPKTFMLQKGEFFSKCTMKHGHWTDNVTLSTNNNRSHSWGGPGGGVSVSSIIPDGRRIIAFFGRYGDHLDSFGCYYLEPVSQ